MSGVAGESEWELSKENKRPLTQFKKPNILQTNNANIPRKIEEERKAFETELKT